MAAAKPWAAVIPAETITDDGAQPVEEPTPTGGRARGRNWKQYLKPAAGVGAALVVGLALYRKNQTTTSDATATTTYPAGFAQTSTYDSTGTDMAAMLQQIKEDNEDKYGALLEQQAGQYETQVGSLQAQVEALTESNRTSTETAAAQLAALQASATAAAKQAAADKTAASAAAAAAAKAAADKAAAALAAEKSASAKALAAVQAALTTAQKALASMTAQYNAVKAQLAAATAKRTYTVVKGDTLSGIGAKVGVAWQTIASLNGIKSPYTIYPGQVLKLN